MKKFLKKTKLDSVIFALLDLIELLLVPFVFLACLIARFVKKPIDIGLGPEPMINNVYHKKALEKYGYSAETFVTDVFFITSQFDVILQERLKKFCSKVPGGALFKKIADRYIGIYAFLLSVFRYKCLYIYFNGGPLGVSRSILWRAEPFLYHLSGVKVLIMPYGGDVQDLLRTANLLYRNGMAKQYPTHRHLRKTIDSKVDLWTRQGDHIISGCDWVYYMYYWDTLMIAHFSIDTDLWQLQPQKEDKRAPLRILHAPNHRELKGTSYFIKAVEELREEGEQIELVLVEKMPNEKVREEMKKADVIADQLIVGWYAMFAIEAMAMGKPVLCYLREDLIELYESEGLIQEGGIPIINCTFKNVKEKVRSLCSNRKKLSEIGSRSRQYVEKHHSLDYVGSVFDRINRGMDIGPSQL